MLFGTAGFLRYRGARHARRLPSLPLPLRRAGVSTDPPHRLARLALLHLTTAAELCHQTLHGLPRLGNEQDCGVVSGNGHGGEDVKTAEDGPSVAEQHRGPFRVGTGGQRVEPGHAVESGRWEAGAGAHTRSAGTTATRIPIQGAGPKQRSPTDADGGPSERASDQGSHAAPPQDI